MRCFLILALVAAASAALAPVYTPAKNRIAGRYIVVLQDGVNVDQVTSSFADKVKTKFSVVLNAFVVEGVDVDVLRALPGVDYVEEDEVVFALGANLNPGSWGIDRVDQRSLPNDGRMALDGYGAGANVYVIDTGINPTHVDFGGRAAIAGDFLGGDGVDCNGHGTHCSGTATGTTYGVANEANVFGIRTLNCLGSGSKADSTAALEWVAANGARPSVASMSLGGSFSATQNAAVANARAAGVVVVVAAGNDNSDACNGSPSSAPEALTIGATDNTDARASYSNWGSCVDLFAPGTDITSAWYTTNTASRTISGTSMACPHVSGIAAVLQAQGYSSEATYGHIASSATADVVSNPMGSPNLFAYVQ